MTSFIFGTIVLGHTAYHTHRREKQRVKNYQRWEGLRDEYDLQKQTQRSSQSLDLQRTGSGWSTPDDDRGILTLRDQQEANDARLSWRPQESFTGSGAATPDRRSSLQLQPTGRGQFSGEFKPQKTGVCWDEGLPAPLRVTRQSIDDPDPFPDSRTSTPARSMSRNSARPSGEYSRASGEYSRTSGEYSRASGEFSREYSRPSGEFSRTSTVNTAHPLSQSTSYAQPPPTRMTQLEPVTSNTPGGRMAELIEGGRLQRTHSPLNPNHNVYSQQLPVEQKLPEVSTEVVGDWWTRP